MQNVQLKVNFILDGRFIRVGSVVGMDQIPKGMRKKKYVEIVGPGSERDTNGRTETVEESSPPPSVSVRQQSRDRRGRFGP